MLLYYKDYVHFTPELLKTAKLFQVKGIIIQRLYFCVLKERKRILVLECSDQIAFPVDLCEFFHLLPHCVPVGSRVWSQPAF